MKTTCQILLFLFLGYSTCAQQFYVRGEVKDEAGNVLQNVIIKQYKTGYIFRTGAAGTFGILAHSQQDTFSFTLDGYRPEKMLVNADNYTRVKLKPAPATSNNRLRDRLSSFTKDLGRDEQKKWFTGDESYASLLDNRFLIARQFPSTGMSLNVDRASYSNIRRFISMNSIVPPDAVRIEEMLNYFNIDYVEPKGSDLFHVNTTLTSCPWNPLNQLYYINLSSRKLNLDTLPPSNLVFLIDVSGSMDMPNRLPLLQSAFRLLVNNLRAKDSVSLVVYGGVTGVMLETTSGAEKEKIIKAIDELTPSGSTPGEAGIRLAYTQARRHFIQGGNNRVILATDGDFNVGLKTEAELDEMISAQRESGVYLTCLGVGMGNYKDSKIQLLAEKGNGNFAYLDNFKEAEKVLLKEFTQTLYSVADDVFMNVEFNPEYVKEYRLIGFDNKVGALRDTSSVVEGGEIGSGFSMMAMFEVEPTDLNRGTTGNANTNDRFSNIRLQYRHPGDTTHRYFDRNSSFSFTPYDQLNKSYHFSAAVAQFGSMLRNSSFVKTRTWNDMVLMAQAAADDSDLLQKEFVNLTLQAKNLYMKGKKKKQ